MEDIGGVVWRISGCGQEDIGGCGQEGISRCSLKIVGVVFWSLLSAVLRISGWICRAPVGVVCLASAGLADVVMAGQPVCPRGEEWGLDLKSSKSKTKHNSLCNCDNETCMTTYTCMHMLPCFQ